MGAVSKTITENSIDLTCLLSAASGIAALHDLGESHCLVDTRDGKCQVLHHPSHTPRRVLGFDHLLQAAVGVDLHCVEVVEPVDESCVLAELLGEGI